MDGQVIYWDDEQPFSGFLTAIISAAALHVFIFWALSYVAPTPLRPILETPISIDLITSQPSTPQTAPPLPTPEPRPLPPQDIITPPVTETPAPRPLPSPDLAPIAEPPLIEPPITPLQTTPQTSVPNIISGPEIDDKEGDDKATSVYIPSQWALEPALSKQRLEGIFGQDFEEDINCIRSLSEDCTSLRKSVFADYQLSEQDLIWTESFAHSGLTSSDLYGLSEREIRQKLAIPIAGDNAFVILPGIAIDGNFWDTLHGVNKKCPVLRGIRRCPDLKPKADDKRFNIPKKEHTVPN